jgi:hypothetical protein
MLNRPEGESVQALRLRDAEREVLRLAPLRKRSYCHLHIEKIRRERRIADCGVRALLDEEYAREVLDAADWMLKHPVLKN